MLPHSKTMEGPYPRLAPELGVLYGMVGIPPVRASSKHSIVSFLSSEPEPCTPALSALTSYTGTARHQIKSLDIMTSGNDNWR